MSMLNFKNHRLLEEIRDNTSKTVLEHNGELQVIAQDELLLIKNELADIKQTLADGTQKVQVSGTNVEMVMIQEPLAIADTGAKWVKATDVSDAKSFYFLVVSSLDVKVVLSVDLINGLGTTGSTARDPDSNLIRTEIIAGTALRYWIPPIPHAVSFRMFLQCPEAPTSGSVSIYIVKSKH